ncbi:unnamed protein product [Hermetia illucens]|uniref:F-box domain-containing protein n=1 Tax=Hermetia illucens TaxID=343691 RepID=A0A7R8UHC5_HERIL|nr:unnamed protein product [Hermetia illucens]
MLCNTRKQFSYWNLSPEFAKFIRLVVFDPRNLNRNRKYMDSPNQSDSAMEKSVMDLNSDCLIYICSFLTPIERFRLALVSDVFNVAIEHFTHLYELQMEELVANFSMTELEEILRNFGEHIKIVNPWSDPPDENICSEYFHLLFKYCHNIEEIGICYPWNPDFETYKRIFESSAKRIRKVSISQKISAQLDDSIDELLCNTSNLTSLELLDSDIAGKHLVNLVNVTDLSLECCESLEPEHFVEFCKVVKLKTLNIAGCRLLNDEAFKTLCETQTELEDLVISNNYESTNYEIVGRLGSLRKFEICECSKQLPKLLKILDELAKYHGNDLETLQIGSNFCYEKEATAGILSRISKFRNLRQMTIPNLNFMNNEESLKEVIQHCPKLEDLRIIVFSNYQWLTSEALLQIITLKCLNRLQIGPIFPLDTNLLPTICKILNAKNGAELNLYLDEGSVDDELLNSLDSSEYKQNERLLKIHIESVDD